MVKKIITAVIMGAFLTGAGFAQHIPNTDVISAGLNEFSEELFNTVPNTALQQGVWSDAWIGKLFPSVPPHFGAGVTVGFAKLDPAGLNKTIDKLNSAGGLEIPDVPGSLVLPTLTFDARIGGVFFPFDAGISIMKIPTVTMNMFGAGFEIDFFTVGGSIRVPVLQGNVVLPKVSVGAGFMYSTGTLTAMADDTAYVSTAFDSKVVYLEAQVSKTFLVVTPFLGLRAIVSSAKNDWAWKYNIAIGGYTAGQEVSGSTTRTLGDNFADTIQPQLFGGLSLNLAIVQTTLSASWDMRNNIWGGNLSLRVKI